MNKLWTNQSMECGVSQWGTISFRDTDKEQLYWNISPPMITDTQTDLDRRKRNCSLSSSSASSAPPVSLWNTSVPLVGVVRYEENKQTHQSPTTSLRFVQSFYFLSDVSSYWLVTKLHALRLFLHERNEKTVDQFDCWKLKPTDQRERDREGGNEEFGRQKNTFFSWHDATAERIKREDKSTFKRIANKKEKRNEPIVSFWGSWWSKDRCNLHGIHFMGFVQMVSNIMPILWPNIMLISVVNSVNIINVVMNSSKCSNSSWTLTHTHGQRIVLLGQEKVLNFDDNGVHG